MMLGSRPLSVFSGREALGRMKRRAVPRVRANDTALEEKARINTQIVMKTHKNGGLEISVNEFCRSNIRTDLNTGFPKCRDQAIYVYTCVCILYRSRVSSGSIVSDYGLDDRANGVRSPAGAEDFSSSLCVQTGSGTHPDSCTMGTGGSFPGGKARPGRDADHSPPSSAEVVND
jgi:hypothetical protein